MSEETSALSLQFPTRWASVPSRGKQACGRLGGKSGETPCVHAFLACRKELM